MLATSKIENLYAQKASFLLFMYYNYVLTSKAHSALFYKRNEKNNGTPGIISSLILLQILSSVCLLWAHNERFLFFFISFFFFRKRWRTRLIFGIKSDMGMGPSTALKLCQEYIFARVATRLEQAFRLTLSYAFDAKAQILRYPTCSFFFHCFTFQ